MNIVKNKIPSLPPIPITCLLQFLYIMFVCLLLCSASCLWRAVPHATFTFSFNFDSKDSCLFHPSLQYCQCLQYHLTHSGYSLNKCCINEILCCLVDQISSQYPQLSILSISLSLSVSLSLSLSIQQSIPVPSTLQLGQVIQGIKHNLPIIQSTDSETQMIIKITQEGFRRIQISRFPESEFLRIGSGNLEL